jgi:hypothetical protein
MTSPPFTPLSTESYLRMFRVIASAVEASDFPSSGACMFFANIGAHLMRVAHGLDAQAKAGVCAFRFSGFSDDPGRNLSFGRINHATRTAIPAGDHFHCWIECEGFVIDLMAPLYREMWPVTAGGPAQLPRRMFQRPAGAMVADILAPLAEGDFYVRADPACTREMAHLVTDYAKLHPEFDILQACEQWYAQAAGPGMALGDVEIQRRDRTLRTVSLMPMELAGAW